jgi:hypothetical protein
MHAPSQGGKLKLVFLNGCESHELGKAVHEAGIPNVVCWETNCEDRAARIFCSAFYTHLQDKSPGETYHEAFEYAKTAVCTKTSMRSSDQWNTPMFELVDPAVRKITASGATAAGIPVFFRSRPRSRSKTPIRTRGSQPAPQDQTCREEHPPQWFKQWYNLLAIFMAIVCICIQFSAQHIKVEGGNSNLHDIKVEGSNNNIHIVSSASVPTIEGGGHPHPPAMPADHISADVLTAVVTAMHAKGDKERIEGEMQLEIETAKRIERDRRLEMEMAKLGEAQQQLEDEKIHFKPLKKLDTAMGNFKRKINKAFKLGKKRQ